MEVKSASTHEISVSQLKSLLTQSAARPVGVFFFVRCQGLLVAVLKLCCGILFAILSLVPLALIQWFPLCHGGSPSHHPVVMDDHDKSPSWAGPKKGLSENVGYPSHGNFERKMTIIHSNPGCQMMVPDCTDKPK